MGWPRPRGRLWALGSWRDSCVPLRNGCSRQHLPDPRLAVLLGHLMPKEGHGLSRPAGPAPPPARLLGPSLGTGLRSCPRQDRRGWREGPRPPCRPPGGRPVGPTPRRRSLCGGRRLRPGGGSGCRAGRDAPLGCGEPPGVVCAADLSERNRDRARRFVISQGDRGNWDFSCGARKVPMTRQGACGLGSPSRKPPGVPLSLLGPRRGCQGLGQAVPLQLGKRAAPSDCPGRVSSP